MGMKSNANNKIFNVSPNIIVSVDDKNMGEMYVYGTKDSSGYILNGATASDLIDYFAYENELPLSEEILDMVMNVNISKTTH